MMFQGAMADAVALWSRAFPDIVVQPMDDADPPARLRVVVAGQALMLFDSPPIHDFGFTPAISLLITCDQPSQIDRLAQILGEGGTVFLPLGEYPFSPRYTWIADPFGINWQIMLAPKDSA